MSVDAWVVLGSSLVVFFIYRYSKNETIKSLKDTLNLRKKRFDEEIEKCKKDYNISLLSEKDKYQKLIEKKDNFYKSLKNSTDPLFEIASVFADFMTYQYKISAHYLSNKKRPAYVEAQRIKELRKETEKYIQQYKLMQYKYEFLLQAFPELEAHVDGWDNLKELSKYESVDSFSENYDNVRNYISREQYEKLGLNERNQLALDKYVNSNNKTDWQIGRDYEMYCAYLYREKGWIVQEFGVQKKLSDMGRDLIAKKDGETLIIQCKRWSKDKTIHEKHLAQLYGTTIMYCIENNIPDEKWGNVYPVFISTTKLSDTALRFAKCLGVRVGIISHNDDFPRIKCNIGVSGEKIYHLPFDQQYDKTIIEPWKGEFYAKTVDEATKAGFRRAYRYRMY
ncbi:MAG: restriction endonuclease [Oscillibacter sp.]|nr:restriction endonuclease [Oscillibacter sp.]